MSHAFSSFDKNFGFGFMRLPMIGDEVDIPQTKQMVDAFLNAGFCYFDTAHGYISGKSELAIRECLSSRYPRDRYILTNKLSFPYFEKEEDIRPLFQQQLDACGVEYFDFYLMHALSAARMPHYRQTRAFEIAQELKEEGKIRHIGISSHKLPIAEEIIASGLYEVLQFPFCYLASEKDLAIVEACKKADIGFVAMKGLAGGVLKNAKAAFAYLEQFDHVY